MAAPVYEIVNDHPEPDFFELVLDNHWTDDEDDYYYFKALPTYTHQYLVGRACRFKMLLHLFQDASVRTTASDIDDLLEDFQLEDSLPASMMTRFGELLELGERQLDTPGCLLSSGTEPLKHNDLDKDKHEMVGTEQSNSRQSCGEPDLRRQPCR
eukprot:TRINITY_DN98860_c0_g1_i1.p1 TRINITY_DN98860_c0_g1~~TRINITY_DN98860_c0_g1_i1.p1  ORF type:complete len:155 (-),score=24.00 TRINITY_DN98860_c0_g1_i1:499-963(-)